MSQKIVVQKNIDKLTGYKNLKTKEINYNFVVQVIQLIILKS